MNNLDLDALEMACASLYLGGNELLAKGLPQLFTEVRRLQAAALPVEEATPPNGRKITARAYDCEHDNIWGVEILLWKSENSARGYVLQEDGFTKSFAEEIASLINRRDAAQGSDRREAPPERSEGVPPPKSSPGNLPATSPVEEQGPRPVDLAHPEVAEKPTEAVRTLIDLCLAFSSESNPAKKGEIWDRVQDQKADITVTIRQLRNRARPKAEEGKGAQL